MKLEHIFIPIFIFGIIIGVFYIEPKTTNGLWTQYGYTAPTANNNVSLFDQTSNTFTKIRTLQCDLNSRADGCPDKQTSVLDPSAGSDNIINSILKGGYGVLVTIMNAISLPKDIILDLAMIIGIPEYIFQPLLAILILVIFLTIFYFVMNRGDLA